MTKEWVRKKTVEYYRSLADTREKIRDAAESQRLLTSTDRNKICTIAIKEPIDYDDVCHVELMWMHYRNLEDSDRVLFRKWCTDVAEDIRYIYTYYECYAENDGSPYEKYLDSDPMHFDGDIIITDPCYIMKHYPEEDNIKYPTCSDFFRHEGIEEYEDYSELNNSSDMYKEDNNRYEVALKVYRKEKEKYDDWSKCYCGDYLDKLGIDHFMTRNTLSGDWSCTTYRDSTPEKFVPLGQLEGESDRDYSIRNNEHYKKYKEDIENSGKILGEFCADSGTVSVISLEEVLKYNPDFDYHTDRDWTTTWIKDFQGDVKFVVTEHKGTYSQDSEYFKKGDEWVEYIVHVVGKGINSKTGESLNFITTQTGF